MVYMFVVGMVYLHLNTIWNSPLYSNFILWVWNWLATRTEINTGVLQSSTRELSIGLVLGHWASALWEAQHWFCSLWNRIIPFFVIANGISLGLELGKVQEKYLNRFLIILHAAPAVIIAVAVAVAPMIGIRTQPFDRPRRGVGPIFPSPSSDPCFSLPIIHANYDNNLAHMASSPYTSLRYTSIYLSPFWYLSSSTKEFHTLVPTDIPILLIL